MHRVASLFTATAAAAVLVSPVSAQSASGVYDFSTGDIQLTIGSGIGVVGLEDFTSNLRPDNLSGELAAAQADASVIAFFNPSGLPEGTFDIGDVVTPGTAAASLGFGFTPIGGQSVTVPLQVINIPEPTALAVLGLGGATLLLRRRSA